MRLIIGGKGQGKLLYSMKTYGFSPNKTVSDFSGAEKAICFTDYQDAVKTLIEQKIDPYEATKLLLERNPDIIILCDEVGCGVVPIDPQERHWRETVGRLCCYLAERAESVERIFCGIPMKLK